MCNLLKNLFLIFSFQQFLIWPSSEQVYNGGENLNPRNGSSASNPGNAAIIKLEVYPDYSTKLDLGNLPGCSAELGATCSISLLPPKDHGIIIVFQYPNQTKFPIWEAALRFTHDEIQDFSQNKMKIYCQDYLKINDGNEPHSAVQTCTYASMVNNRMVFNNFFQGTKYYLNNPNEGTTLILHQSGSNSDSTKTHKMPNIIVTSYIDCSKLGYMDRRLYTECSPDSSDGSGAATKCIPTKLFCDGNPNCVSSNGDAEQVRVGSDETECNIIPKPAESSTNLFPPLFPIISTEPPPTFSTTTKRPWWKWPFQTAATTPSPTTTTPTTTTVEPYYRTVEYEGVHTPWYSPTSAFGTVLIFIGVVILIFGICSFLAKVHSTRRSDFSNSACEPSNNGGIGTEGPFSAESTTFARQLIEMIEEEDRRSQRRSPSPRRVRRASTTFIPIDELSPYSAPPPTYIDDSTLPSYDSLFANTNEPNNANNNNPSQLKSIQ